MGIIAPVAGPDLGSFGIDTLAAPSSSAVAEPLLIAGGAAWQMGVPDDAAAEAQVTVDCSL
jgi:hypothetical protein